MNSNLERFQKDLEALIKRGGQLHVAIQAQFHPDEIIEALKQGNIEDPEKFVKKLPSFELDYQSWYSEAQAVVRQILPDRLTDFVSPGSGAFRHRRRQPNPGLTGSRRML